ncbi:hypothetical protein AS19_18620 [Alcanivorax sp. NBRC 101098]|uniref:hypothetical protein n=1 Tax=Alcanivorax sp. NBRC 101098 TaxID=1113728 RepID=UPI0004ABD57D|nr:hypothetical protein [Alcanivorax sp. NBRC 101098]BAP14713.1 hypothetical protein AS19_18620 [Alcanivorax sp. NBRC 101098]
MSNLTTWLPILSLVVAALAVFVGPFVSFQVAKSQSKVSLKVANKQIIAPMRQIWINKLRDLVAEILGKSAHYYGAGFEEREDSEYLHITELEYRLQLLLNTSETDHKQLITHVRSLINSLAKSGAEQDEAFRASHKAVSELTPKILKREWDRTKSEI